MLKIRFIPIIHIFSVLLLLGLKSNHVKGNNPLHIIDSLSTLVQKNPKDTNTVIHHLRIADMLRSRNTPLSLLHLDTARMLGTRFKFKSGLAEYHFLRGKTFGMLANYRQAISHFDSAVVLYKPLAMNNALAKAYLFKGMCHGYLGKYTLAYNAYSEALNLVDQNEEYGLYADLLEAVANVYNSMGDLKTAITYYRQIETQATANDDLKRKHLAIGNIGQTLAGLSHFDEGLKLLIEALVYFKKQDDVYQISAIYSNIAYIYGAMGDYLKAIEYYEKAIDVAKHKFNYHNELIFKKGISQCKIKLGKLEEGAQTIQDLINDFAQLGDDDLLSDAYSIMGGFYSEQNKYSDALIYYRKAYQLSDRSERPEKRLGITLLYAHSLYKNAQYQESLQLLPEVVRVASEKNLRDDIAEGYRISYLNYEKTGNWEQALLFYKKYKEELDSIDIQTQINQIEKLSFEFETRERDREIKQLKAESELKKELIARNEIKNKLQLLVFILTLGFLFWAFFSYNRRKKLEFKHLQTTLELKALRAQLNPHFIFNTLASIHSVILSHDANKSAAYLLQFSKLMRLILDNSRKNFVDLSSEIEFIKLYLTLEAVRLNHSFDFSVNANTLQNTDNILIPAMLIQPFVENAVWHGISGLNERKGFIEIEMNEQNNMLQVRIKDNGKGKEGTVKSSAKFRSKKHLSHGISITQERLEMMNHISGNNASLTVTEMENGFEVVIHIPIDRSILD